MTQVCINQHFVEKRGTAAGVVEALAAINGIVFPPLLEVSPQIDRSFQSTTVEIFGCKIHRVLYRCSTRSDHMACIGRCFCSAGVY